MPRSSRLSKDGRITIPKNVREMLDLRPGDRIDWNVEGDAVRLRRQLRLREVIGMLKAPEGMSFEQMMERADDKRASYYAAKYVEESQ